MIFVFYFVLVGLLFLHYLLLTKILSLAFATADVQVASEMV